jgi:hypothetical protein
VLHLPNSLLSWQQAVHRAARVAAGATLVATTAWLVPLATSPLEAQDAVVRRNAATLPFEHGLIVIDAHSDGQVVVGASVGDSTIATPLPAPEVKLWADSTARLLARRVPKAAKPRVYRSGVVNRETSAGISFTRRISGGKSSYRLFFANTSYGGFPFDVSRSEADQLVQSLRSAVKMARALSRPPRSKTR